MKTVRLMLLCTLVAAYCVPQIAQAEPAKKKAKTSKAIESATAEATPADSPAASPAATSETQAAPPEGAAGASPSPSMLFELPDPVAVVEGKPIAKADLESAFNLAVSTSGGTPDSLTPQQKEQGYRSILDDLVIERLISARATDIKVTDEEVDETLQKVKSEFPSEAELKAELEKVGQTLDSIKVRIRTSLQQQKWIESQIAGKTTPTEADAKKFYEENPDKFQQPETVKASHILIATPPDAKPEQVAEKEKIAKEVHARVTTKQEAFENVAKEVSEDPGTKENGGDLDYFSRDRMVPEFSEAAWKLEIGQISEPVRSQFGFHIIKLTDKKPSRVVPFEEAKDRIMNYLSQQKRRESIQSTLGELRSKADVKINLPGPKQEAGPEVSPTQ
jgi:peptidyl-prolyl cis-trans isomerase C